MQSQQDLRTILYRIAEESLGPAVDVLGPTIEFITPPSRDDDSALCVLRGVVPPGVTVPMHSHEDAEDFYILAGTQEVLTQHPEGLEWAHARAGDYVRVPPGTMHAHRNGRRTGDVLHRHLAIAMLTEQPYSRVQDRRARVRGRLSPAR